MIFTSTDISGVLVVDVEPSADERGLFARTFDRDAFVAHGLQPPMQQCSTSFNPVAHTLRGLHYQAAPHDETKLVRCTRGAAFDVAVDLRSSSPTYLAWVGFELTADNRRALYISPGVAHGFMTLAADTELLYQIEGSYIPEAARGLRWNDPAIDISWPFEPALMSQRDARFEDHA